MKYLPLYKKWMKTETLPAPGLCRCFPGDRILNLMKPDNDFGYWAHGGRFSNDYNYTNKFTPLRQTIVLFMAAINKEL